MRVIKILCKLVGAACLIEWTKQQLSVASHSLRDNLSTQAKKVGWLLVFGGFGFMLLSMALRFLLLGLAYWLNSYLSSAYLGFFIVSLGCFLAMITLFWLLWIKMQRKDVDVVTRDL